MKKKIYIMSLMIALSLGTYACGGSASNEGNQADTATEATAEDTQPEEANGGEEASDTQDAAVSGDVGKYVIYEYEGNGNKVSHEMLEEAGMGNTYLELYEDGTGKLNLFESLVDITWGDGKVTVYGTSDYDYTVDGDTLTLDMQGVVYTMKRDGSETAADQGTKKKGKERDESTQTT